MIYVALGTEKLPFHRLLEWVERALTDGNIKEEVVVQFGNTPYNPSHPKIKAVQWMPYEEIDRLMKECSTMVLHAGVGNFLQARSHGRIPILVPRKHDLGEHLDDHQIALVKQLQTEFKMPYADSYESFVELLHQDLDNLQIASHRAELLSYLDQAVQK